MARSRAAAVMATLYHNPACSKSRAAHGLLAEKGEAVNVVEYLNVAWTRASLDDLLRKLAPGEASPNPTLMMRTGDAAFKELGLDKLDPAVPASREALLDAMVRQPSLIERPIFVREGRAVIGRPPDRVFELLP
ncbi:arsenate reductase [Achlya hypogyna]|uniref:Arsenate reductase n=1 Tax=Achlya hypogyna TaxID=1202772 RepID=A0A1V9Z1Z4_ACHHY|nr:arsenate reductase [Achlya hypogyna]